MRNKSLGLFRKSLGSANTMFFHGNEASPYVYQSVTSRSYATMFHNKTNIPGRSGIPPQNITCRGLIIAADEKSREIVRANHKQHLVEGVDASILQGTRFTENQMMEAMTMLVTRHDEEYNIPGRIISTTSADLNQDLRDERKCQLAHNIKRSEALQPGDTLLGGIDIETWGPYFGGSPSVFLTGAHREQIYPDALVCTMPSIKAASEMREEQERHGPRISSACKVAFVQDANHGYATRLVSDHAFVNSTVHRGVQLDSSNNEHPVTYYTPGTNLIHQVHSSISVRHDGSTLQTVSLTVNACADVLCHWLIKSIHSANAEKAGVSKISTENGLVTSWMLRHKFGKIVADFATLLTGTPFDMSTITIHRDKNGDCQNIMIHKITKPWPANESVIKIRNANGKVAYTILDSLMPNAGFFRDLTVGKLTTPVMSESTVSYRLDNGQLHPICDDELVQDMSAHNKISRPTWKQLSLVEAPLSMVLASWGINATERRSRVTRVSTTNTFDHDSIIRQHIKNNSSTMEYYFCGRWARIVAENLQAALNKDFALWSQNESVQRLWHIVTSKIPSSCEVSHYQKEFKTILDVIITDEDKPRLQSTLDWIRESALVTGYDPDEVETLEDPQNHFYF